MMKRALIIVGTLAAFVVIAPVVLVVGFLWVRPLFHPLPPLLKHVTAKGGWYGACPPRNQQEEQSRLRSGEALSPELNQRLAEQFPPGSSGPELSRFLMSQGFKQLESCENDTAIHRAYYDGPISGVLLNINANVYWKTEENTIVWTKGFVAYGGL
jgi:hypothetical protein